MDYTDIVVAENRGQLVRRKMCTASWHSSIGYWLFVTGNWLLVTDENRVADETALSRGKSE
jgi:hypothetical protein